MPLPLKIKDGDGKMPIARMREIFERTIADTDPFRNRLPIAAVEINGEFSHYEHPDTDTIWIGFAIGLRAAERIERVTNRKQEIRCRWMEREIRRIDEALDLANIPDNVPHGEVLANSPSARLHWFLMRRKDVKAAETVGCYSDLELALMAEEAENPRETDNEELERGEDFV